MKAASARVLLASILLSLTFAGRAWAADRVEACASAAEESQSLRTQGQLTAARKKLVVCADAACPGVVKKHCTTWLAEVDKATPSVVVRARDARGLDVGGARVSVDGTEIASSITGLPVPIDPGPHTVRVVAVSGAIAEQKVVIAEGEKDRPVVLTFKARLSSDGSSDGAAPSVVVTPPPPPPSSPSPSRITPPFLITAGIGVVALGAFTTLEVLGHSDYSKLKDECGVGGQKCPNGSGDLISSGRSKFVGAGVALGVTGVALGLATVILIIGPAAPKPAAAAAKSFFVARPDAPPSLGVAHF